MFSVVKGFIRASKREEAVKIFSEMASKNFSPIVTYNTLIDGLCKAGRFAEAYSLLKDMLEK